jgi:hypothetical protein
MTRTVDTLQLVRPRQLSPEERAELFRQIVARDPIEGPRIVEVHKQIIALLDAMIDKQRRRAG